jgi:hypothetical protein
MKIVMMEIRIYQMAVLIANLFVINNVQHVLMVDVINVQALAGNLIK